MKSYAGSTSTLDLPGGLSGGVAGVVGTKGSVVAAVDPDDDAYFGTVSSNSRYGSVDAEAANRSVPKYTSFLSQCTSSNIKSVA